MSIILAPILGTENYLTEKTFCFMKKRGFAFLLEEDVNVIYIFVNGGAMWIARLDVRWCSFVLVQNMVVPLSWHDKLAQKSEKLKIPKSSLTVKKTEIWVTQWV